MSLHLDRKLARMEALAGKRGAVVYALLKRNAGWAVQWHEEARCVTPEPPAPPPLRSVDERTAGEIVAAMRVVIEARLKRTTEGLIVYAYRPTLIEAVEYEISRLVQTPMKE